MPIPRTRAELVGQLSSTFGKLRVELESGRSGLADLHCVDGWNVKDLLALTDSGSSRQLGTLRVGHDRRT
jgi:hypothetical protein